MHRLRLAVFAAVLAAANAGCQTLRLWGGVLERTSKDPVVIGWTGAAGPVGRAVVVQYAAGGYLDDAHAYAVLPADAEWRTAWSVRGMEDFAARPGDPSGERWRAVAAEAARVAASGPFPAVATARPPGMTVDPRALKVKSFTPCGDVLLIPYDPPDAVAGVEPRRRWLAVPTAVPRPVDQRAGMPVGALVLTPPTLAYDVVTLPYYLYLGAPYFFAWARASLENVTARGQ